MSRLEENTIQLLNTKIFMDDYTKENRVMFLGQDLDDWISYNIKNTRSIG